MDSKQLEQLGKIASTPLTVSEVYNLVSKQILIGKMSITSLKHQAEYCELLKKAQDYTIKMTNKKIELLEELNKLREEQLKEFDEFTQEQCNKIVDDINDLDSPSAEYYEISKQLNNKKDEQNTLIERIEYLQGTLPNEVVLDFYKVKPKLAYNPIGTCATESDLAPE